jgi:hypothetical protein
MVMVLSSDGVGDIANVFRYKEVLKKAHNTHGDNNIVPVYGVYVHIRTIHSLDTYNRNSKSNNHVIVK